MHATFFSFIGVHSAVDTLSYSRDAYKIKKIGYVDVASDHYFITDYVPRQDKYGSELLIKD